MALLKSNMFSEIKGSIGGTVYKRDKFGLHAIATPRIVHKEPTAIQKSRRAAFIKCHQFIKTNANNELMQRWSDYKEQKSAWKEQFIAFNINRIIEGRPVKRFPPCQNIIIDGEFNEEGYWWTLDPSWSIDAWRAIYTGSEIAFIHQYPDFVFTGGRQYRFSFEIEQITNTQLTAFIGDVRGEWHSAKGLAREILTPTLTGIQIAGLIAQTPGGTGTAIAYDLIID